MLRLEGTGGTFDISWNLNTANMLASGGNNIALGSPLMTQDVFPGTDNTYNLGRRTAYGYWKDFYMKGTNCLTWYDSVPSTNWVTLESYMSGPQATFNLFSETNGVNGPVTGITFATNGVPMASITGAGIQTHEILIGAMGVSRGTLTHANGNVIVDFSPTNRYWSCTTTGAVTFVLTNAAAGKWANILLYNTQATNCPPTFNFPAGSKTNWFGGAPSTLTAGTVGSLSYYATSTDTNAVLAAYTETQ